MSACVETMFSVREKPWHGLGTIIEEAPTSADALRIAGLDWKVEQRDVFTSDGTKIPNYKANVRDKDGSILGCVTDRYKIVQNEEAFAFTDALIGGDVHYETAGSLRNGRTVWMLAQMPKRQILGDDVDPYLCFTNSHDGTGAIRVCMTPVRVVCNNTLNFALKTAKRQWATRHMGDIESKMEEAQRTLEMAGEYMDELAIEAVKLADQKLTDDDIASILDQLYPVKEDDSDRVKDNAKAMKDGIMVAYYAPDIAKFLGTKYGFMNAVADFVGHATPNRNTNTYKERNWERIIGGHAILDKTYELLTAC